MRWTRCPWSGGDVRAVPADFPKGERTGRTRKLGSLASVSQHRRGDRGQNWTAPRCGQTHFWDSSFSGSSLAADKRGFNTSDCTVHLDWDDMCWNGPAQTRKKCQWACWWIFFWRDRFLQHSADTLISDRDAWETWLLCRRYFSRGCKVINMSQVSFLSTASSWISSTELRRWNWRRKGSMRISFSFLTDIYRVQEGSGTGFIFWKSFIHYSSLVRPAGPIAFASNANLQPWFNGGAQ